MRFRTLASACAVAAVATLPLAGVASAQPDRDCPDFPTQAAAQAALDSQPGDRERLDANDNGIACEAFFTDSTGAAPSSTPRASTPAPTPSRQVGVVPQGGVDTGDGTASDSGAPLVILLGSAAVVGVAAATRRAVRRSS